MILFKLKIVSINQFYQNYVVEKVCAQDRVSGFVEASNVQVSDAHPLYARLVISSTTDL